MILDIYETRIKSYISKNLKFYPHCLVFVKFTPSLHLKLFCHPFSQKSSALAHIFFISPPRSPNFCLNQLSSMLTSKKVAHWFLMILFVQLLVFFGLFLCSGDFFITGFWNFYQTLLWGSFCCGLSCRRIYYFCFHYWLFSFALEVRILYFCLPFFYLCWLLLRSF